MTNHTIRGFSDGPHMVVFDYSEPEPARPMAVSEFQPEAFEDAAPPRETWWRRLVRLITRRT